MLLTAVALALLQTAPEFPADPLGWKQLGIKLAANRQLEKAVAAFTKACPVDWEACYYLGRTLFTMARYDQARGPFEQALRAAPIEVLPKLHRATALNFVALVQPADAERHFREAIRLSRGMPPGADDARIDYGSFLFRQGRSEEALGLLEQAAQAAPGSAPAQMELGRVLLHMGKREQAAKRLEKALVLDSRLSAAHLLLGRAYIELGRVEEGEQQLRLGQQEWNKGYGSATVK